MVKTQSTTIEIRNTTKNKDLYHNNSDYLDYHFNNKIVRMTRTIVNIIIQKVREG